MTAFIRDYIAAVSSDPDTAWEMLTPRFQQQSGGLATYREFWDGVGTARILEISADPRTLVVSYRVRFANFGTGRQTTVLDLVFEDGRYLIDGERT
jgi:3',5'-cyclic AMP phosphodiesterase CpdA